MKKYDIVIIDGMNRVYMFNYVHRHLSVKSGSLQGHPTGIIYGFIDFIRTIKHEHPGSLVYVVWDSPNLKKKSLNINYKVRKKWK